MRPEVRLVGEHVQRLAALLQHVLRGGVALHRPGDGCRGTRLREAPAVRLPDSEVQQHRAGGGLQCRKVEVRAHDFAHELRGAGVRRPVDGLIVECEIPQRVHRRSQERAVRLAEALQHAHNGLDAPGLDEAPAVVVIGEGDGLECLANLGADRVGPRVLMQERHQGLDLMGVLLADGGGECRRLVRVGDALSVDDGACRNEGLVQARRSRLLLEALVLLDQLLDEGHDLAVPAAPDKIRQVELLPLAAAAARQGRRTGHAHGLRLRLGRWDRVGGRVLLLRRGGALRLKGRDLLTELCGTGFRRLALLLRFLHLVDQVLLLILGIHARLHERLLRCLPLGDLRVQRFLGHHGLLPLQRRLRSLTALALLRQLPLNAILRVHIIGVARAMLYGTRSRAALVGAARTRLHSRNALLRSAAHVGAMAAWLPRLRLHRRHMLTLQHLVHTWMASRLSRGAIDHCLLLHCRLGQGALDLPHFLLELRGQGLGRDGPLAQRRVLLALRGQLLLKLCVRGLRLVEDLCAHVLGGRLQLLGLRRWHRGLLLAEDLGGGVLGRRLHLLGLRRRVGGRRLGEGLRRCILGRGLHLLGLRRGGHGRRLAEELVDGVRNCGLQLLGRRLGEDLLLHRSLVGGRRRRRRLGLRRLRGRRRLAEELRERILRPGVHVLDLLR
mmetsp:Transcript_113969/g.329192  ORF Transcript_113969/g.329192 Transcript_113969/m.329192 type:complete len:669 (+) Transcript_113969:228-2234(+)